MTYIEKFLELTTKKVKTPQGALKFGTPIGTDIIKDARVAPKNKAPKPTQVKSDQIKKGDSIQGPGDVGWQVVVYVKDRGDKFAFYDAHGKLIREVVKGVPTEVHAGPTVGPDPATP